ncbi:MAG: cobalamin biosynthesis protein CbiD, partial [Planctomycetes bacterium]|nr:cobalamin biosynthesis protein CbiD [Planctomycetota bacterium]
TPAGVKLNLKIQEKQLSSESATCAVQKDAGDDPDVTNGCFIHAKVERRATHTIEIDGGDGVGRVTKPGLQVPVGQAAINPVPRRMIEEAVRGIIGKDAGAKVIITVPTGRVLGEKTFNPKLGIVGGISIIGTTGIVRPMSEDAFQTSLLCGLNIARGSGYETVALVPVSLGERSLLGLIDVAKEQVVQISNFVGFMLKAACERGFKKIILAGHPGKLAKLLRGDFHTHSAVSKPANDILIETVSQYIRTTHPPFHPPFHPPSPHEMAKGEAESTLAEKSVYPNKKDIGHPSNEIIGKLKASPTVEGIVELLRDSGYLPVMNNVAEELEVKVRDFLHGKALIIPETIGIILFDMKGTVIGISNNAQTWLNTTKTKSSL